VPRVKEVTRVLSAIAAGRGLPGAVDVSEQIFYDVFQVAAATVGANLIFNVQSANKNYDVRNLPWDGSKLPANRGIRIRGIGIAINSDVRADVSLLEFGVSFRMEVEDNVANPKIEPIPLRLLVPGGGSAVALDGAAAALEAAWGQGPAGQMFELATPIDVDPNESYTAELYVPTALGAISASTNLLVAWRCVDIRGM